MIIGHQPKDFLLSVEALTVSFDGVLLTDDGGGLNRVDAVQV